MADDARAAQFGFDTNLVYGSAVQAAIPRGRLEMKALHSRLGRIQLIADKVIYFSRGLSIFSYEPDAGIKYISRFPSSPIVRAKAAHRLGQRLFRATIHHVVPTASGGLTVFGPGLVARLDIATGEWGEVTQIVGSRPLRVAVVDGRVYYGEYRDNRERSPISVWVDDAGSAWHPAYTFQGVRHIHGVFWDPYEQMLWVTTGDEGRECGLWKASPDFASISRIPGEGQRFRAVDLLFTPNSVLFASDAPNDRNHIFSLDRKTLISTQIAEIAGPVFYGSMFRGEAYFCTVCEPSKVNDIDRVHLYKFNEKVSTVEEVLSLKKDLLPKKLFQYGQLWFPYTDGSVEELFCSPLGVEKDGKIMIVDGVGR